MSRDFAALRKLLESNVENLHTVEWNLSGFYWKNGADPAIPADKPWALPVAWARSRGHSETRLGKS